ncbi:MAG TPA: glucose-6-phosphate dehydrogenase assembly protein OpcA, partial [Minicystis sp.]|nr:glucose-6-phosphate dehydrogenase assembly protein OpcA [Minicystis sp.]
GTERPKVRATTMNFVVASAPAELPRLRDELQVVAEERAGRVFLVTVDGRREPWDVDAEVSATCQKTGEDVVCHDRVELAFGAVAAERAGSVVTSLALSEVPTIVEIGRGAPGSLVDPLVRVADRLIVDSSHTPIDRLAAVVKKTNALVTDRAMVRSFQWRDLVARFFDAAPGAERAIRSVTVTRTPGGAHGPDAMLLGWIGSRLGWTFTSRAAAKDARGEDVRLAVAEQARGDVGAAELLGVEITATYDGKPLVAACAREPDAAAVRWTMRGPVEQDHVHALGHRDEVWVLLKAIDAALSDGMTRAAILAAAAYGAS